jgi:outer membrane protein assembly factor BamB
VLFAAAMFLLAFAPLRLCASASAADWAHWRGPEQNGVSREKDLPESFSTDPADPKSNLIWKAPVGGRTTPIVMNGRVFLINSVGEGINQQERVMALDADTGKILWQHKFNIFHTDIVSDRLGWTNLAGDPETGNVYAHGTSGLFFCFNRDGKVLWSHSLTEEYGRISGYGGRITSPIVDGDLVIISILNANWGDQARGGNRYVAFDKRTGKVVWWSSPGAQPKDTYNSVPVVAVINGERLLLSGGGDGQIHALKVRTGEKVWTYQIGAAAVNCSPVVDGNFVYIAHGDENVDANVQGRVVCLDASKVKDGKPALVWKKDALKIKFASPIIHDGRLYVCDDICKMFCLDAKTGNLLWRFSYGRNCKGSPVLADGKIYVGEVNSKFHILKPGPKRCEELYEQFFPSKDGVADAEINGSPAVANGRVYFMTTDETYCIGKKGHKATADPPPPQAKEAPVDPKGKAAHLQVVPADVTLAPGGNASFSVRLFNDKGQFLREAKDVKWALPPGTPPPGAKEGPPPLKGEITAGKLTVDKSPAQFGLVQASADGLTGLARVRVAPLLPYTQDFSKVPEGRAPAGWANTQGKFVVEMKNGAKVLKKTNIIPSPLVARANAYIGMPDLTDYTIQADVMGTQKGKDVPDLGVVANRYTLKIEGETKGLRLVSWEAIPRIDKTIGTNWKPNVWYTMKLTVDVKGDKALVRGKFWERGKPEPKDWTVELEDPTPNREGSPALFALSTGIDAGSPGNEVFFANVSVTPNRK